MKRLMKQLFATAIVLSSLASCMDNEGNSQAGFVYYDDNGNLMMGVKCNSTAYANTQKGKLTFMSYGDWSMTVGSGTCDWFKPDTTRGRGWAIYSIPTRYKHNTTGASRVVNILLQDVNNSDDAYINFSVGQYATRGDGSMGYAPLVSSIKGDDGSDIEIAYDSYCRPTSLVMSKGETTYRNMQFTWADSTVAINGSMRGSIGVSYQPTSLVSTTDTVGLYSQNIYPVYSDVVFNFEEHRDGGSEYIVQALKLEGQTLDNPDGDRHIDSLRYVHRTSSGVQSREYMKLTYGSSDNFGNCYQSVDANQLVLGIDECNPYLLLGLFRSARSTRLITEASTTDGKYTIEATRNADKSLNTLTVTDKSGKKTVYTFAYHPNSLWQ